MSPLGDLGRVVRWSLTTMAAAALAAAVAENALGATVGVWTGPGDRACAGRCSEEWARAQLPPSRQAELARAGAPVETVIGDGAVIGLMTYYAGGPVAQHGAVAMLAAPEPATCRVLDGWSWCLVHGCQNWAAVEHASPASFIGATRPSRNETPFHAVALPSDGVWLSAAYRSDVRACCGEPHDPPVNLEIPPVPLPAPLWLLAGALGILIRLASSRSPAGARAGACRPVGCLLLNSPALRRRGLFGGRT